MLSTCLVILIMCSVSVPCRLFRSGGTFGTAIVTWEITPADSNTFASSTGGVVFGDGNTTASIVIQVSCCGNVFSVDFHSR